MQRVGLVQCLSRCLPCCPRSTMHRARSRADCSTRSFFSAVPLVLQPAAAGARRVSSDGLGTHEVMYFTRPYALTERLM